jgi:glycosyltransferase involved in cell wall biosynthesis
MPQISVVIPTYNGAHYLGAAIASVLAQTFQDCEIIVVDDGSTDDTATVLGAFENRLIYRQQPHSGRPACARNVGLQIASGQYIAFLDADDLFEPERLAMHVAALQAHPDWALVYSDAEYFKDEGSELGSLLNGRAPFTGQVFFPLLMSNFIVTCGATVRKNCLAEIGFFDEDPRLAGVEDYDLWLRIAARHPMGFVPGLLSRVRIHSANISGGDKLAQYLGTLEIMAKMRRLYPSYVAGCQAQWQERCSLMHLAAARAYGRRKQPGRLAEHLIRACLAKPDPRWWGYLISTPKPARAWLEQVWTLTRST